MTHSFHQQQQLEKVCTLQVASSSEHDVIRSCDGSKVPVASFAEHFHCRDMLVAYLNTYREALSSWAPCCIPVPHLCMKRRRSCRKLFPSLPSRYHMHGPATGQQLVFLESRQGFFLSATSTEPAKRQALLWPASPLANDSLTGNSKRL